MDAIRCPYCGAANPGAPVLPRDRSDGSFVCQSCGKAVEPPPARHPHPHPHPHPPPPPIAGSPPSGIEDGLRWSAGPPEESAKRWSTIAPFGDDESASNVSVSQSSILPRESLEEPTEPPSIDGGDAPRPARSPLAWLLVIFVLFILMLIGAIMLARSIRPWLDARRTAAARAKAEFWWPKLDSGPEVSSREAARAIVELGPAAIVKTLDHISQDPGTGEDFQFVLPAVHGLAEVGPDAATGLGEGLRSPEPKVRAAAAAVIQVMGPAGRATRDQLLAALDDENRWVRFAAIDALGSLGGDGAPATERLAKLAASRDFTSQRHAIDALGRIGPAAGDALPTLETVGAKDIDPMIRSRAKLAAKQIDVRELAGKARREARGPLKPLLQAVLSEDVPAAIAAAAKLGDMGLAAEPAAVGLAAMLHDDDPVRRAAAATALGKIRLGATEFVPTLESAATDDDPRVRAAATEALEMINGKPK